jgi:hypothetical protein
LIAVGLLVTCRSYAAGGRIEINQACAVDTGCGPGDSPGFPVGIGSGSYVLTSNLVVTDPATSALFVTGAHTWIDLRGFTISGPTSCASPGPACAPAGNGVGIFSTGAAYTTVVNGVVRGFATDGVQLRDHSRVSNILVSENGRSGITCGNGCVIRRVRAVRNGMIGISTLNHTILVGNIADGNGAAGISTMQGTVVTANTSDGNGGSGIDALAGGNAVHENQARRNADNGIRASAGAIVEGNTVTENAVRGLFLNNAAGYGFNVIRSDPGVPGSITVNAGPQNLGNNLCNGVTTCP